MLDVVHELLAGALRERGLDGRTCHTRVTPIPPDGSTVEVECSDAATAAGLAARLEGRGLATRVRVVTLPAGPLPEGLIAASSVADVRRTAAHTAELVTQVVYGDAVTPLKAEGEWFLVRVDDGYVGWIRSWHLVECSPGRRADFLRRSTHRVASNHAMALSSPGAGALPVSDLVVGIPVVVAPGGGVEWAAVELPDGKPAFVPWASLEAHPAAGPPSREGLVTTGLRFLGIPYLWGGSTPKGFDCSGLVQRIYRLHGRVLPRDADMQAGIGPERPPGDVGRLLPGDLVFFGRDPARITHVGMALPDRTFLHAYGQVIVSSLDPSHPRYLPALARDWRLSRDPLCV